MNINDQQDKELEELRELVRQLEVKVSRIEGARKQEQLDAETDFVLTKRVLVAIGSIIAGVLAYFGIDFDR